MIFNPSIAQESIIRYKIKMPITITLDLEERKLYWADERLNKMERVTSCGASSFYTPEHPFAVAVSGNLLFWSDWIVGALVRANEYTRADIFFRIDRIDHPMAVVAEQNTIVNCDGNQWKILNGSYEDPSSRPESDFTLDLPRAEQLRIKMEKEKKFRQRCRLITTFLSLIFFLLTVMVVSLVLTRGKRMFGSMI
uniref:Uncharacterized protein n=1 Tax=Glossina austeni TaxID=7395 RepID=A0A1A9V2H5_GLOAU